MNKRLEKTITIPLYFERLKIVVVDKLDKPDYAAYVSLQKNLVVLHLTPLASAGVVAHEAVHIVNHIFQQCDIMLDIHNDEPQAYLTGWVVDQITNVLALCKKTT